jgi:hypothetical protein
MWIQSYTTLADLYHIPVIGVSNVGWMEGGAWDGWKCIGCSIAMGGDGKLLAMGPYGDNAEAFVTVECTVTPRKERGTTLIQSLAAKGYKGP